MNDMKGIYRFRRFCSLFLVMVLLLFICTGCEKEDYNNIESIHVSRGTAMAMSGLIMSERTWRYLSYADDINDIVAMIDNMKKMQVEPITEEDQVYDTEYLRFDFWYDDGSESSLYLLYDYDTKKEYVLYHRTLYRLLDYTALWEENVKPAMNYGRGDSYVLRNAYFNGGSFQYEQHWKSDDYDKNLFEYYDFSTVVQPKTEIRNRTEAVQTVKTALGLEYCRSLCLYDRNMEYYLVILYCAEGISEIKNIDLQGREEDTLYVVIASDGSLVEVYSVMQTLFEYIKDGLS